MSDKATNTAPAGTAPNRGKALWHWRAAVSESIPWLIAFLFANALFVCMAWLAYPDGFFTLLWLMLSISLAIILLTLFLRARKYRLALWALDEFLLEPDDFRQAHLTNLLPHGQRLLIQQLAFELSEVQAQLLNAQTDLDEYQTYIESWVHEMKTPLALMLLVLNNRSAQLDSHIMRQMTHVHTQLGEQIETVLYFARLRAAHKDYIFETLDLREQISDAIQRNHALLEEAGLKAEFSVPGESPDISFRVTSDRNGLGFILNQIISNAAKHANTICFELMAQAQHASQSATSPSSNICLRISDNGPGVSPSDLPFIFDRGFTGGKQNLRSTGLGLYLVARMANDLCIDIQAASLQPESGLQITLSFPL
jgi:signal transduction histidine kinase